MTLVPLNDGLVVKRKQQDAKTPGGIILPDNAKEKAQMGEVVAAGPGKMKEDGTRIPMNVKVGDNVMFTKYGPTEVKHEGEEVLFLNESDVLAIVS